MSKRRGEDMENTKTKKPRKVNVMKEREKDEEFIDVTTNGRKIMPSNMKKYAGSITKRSCKWTVRFQSNDYARYNKYSFTSQDEAEAYIKNVNVRENLTKNIIYNYKDQYYCVLTRNRLMKFSFEDLDLVESHIWCCVLSNTLPYAATNVLNSKRVKKMRPFHQFILTDINDNETCDHINRDSLDNTRKNLRTASITTQLINRGIFSSNSSNVPGVSYHKKYRQWRACWRDKGAQKVRVFSVATYGYDGAKAKATAYRREIEKTLSHYRLALENDIEHKQDSQKKRKLESYEVNVDVKRVKR
jgi:hypothetical protein